MKTRCEARNNARWANCLLACLACAAAAAAPLPAFPGAEGFGALATGGRGGEIFHVTSLEDSGPGTFRDAVSRPRRIIVFDVAGVVRLKSNVSGSGDLTVLGQTAPGEGIALYGRSVSFSGRANVIVRCLRMREGIGGDKGKCSLNLAGAANMIFDHDSIEWGRWDCLGLTKGSHDITFQNCLLGQGIAPQRFGALVDSALNITFSHNLWIDNQSRNPKAKGAIQYINNVVYNWGGNGLVGGHSGADHQLDVIGNYFIKGPSSSARFASEFTSTDQVFQKDNYADLDRDGRLHGRLVVAADFGASGNAPTFAAAPFMHPQIPVTIEPAPVAFLKALEGAGCSRERDEVDRRLIAELASLGGSGHLVQNEAEAGGMGEIAAAPLPVSTVHDGIPDQWKTAHGVDPKDPRAASQPFHDGGYVNMEEYAEELAPP